MEALITQYIQAILQRDPNPGEVEGYVAQITTGTQTTEGVIDALLNGQEAVDIVYPVIRAYQAVYGRVPDAGGLDFWVDAYRVFLVDQDLDNPATTTVNEATVELLKYFVDPVQTPEFAQRFGTNPSALAFVNACYTNVLNREPDQAGLNYWEGVYNDVYAGLDSANPAWTDAEVAKETRAIILEQFVNSDEYATSSDLFMQEFLHDAAEGSETFEGPLWEKYPYDVEVADQTVVETDAGQKVVTITIMLDKPAEGDLVLNYHTVGGTGVNGASAGNDYVTSTGTVTVEDGQTSATIEIVILGDTINEADESFTVVFDTPYAAVETATVTIIDNDSDIHVLTPGIDLFTQEKAGGPLEDVYLAGERDLGSSDRIDGGDGEDTLLLTINKAFDIVGGGVFGGYYSGNVVVDPIAGQLETFTIADDLQNDPGKFLAAGYGTLWGGFTTEDVEVLVVSNSDETLFGNGSAWDVEESYGIPGSGLSESGGGGFYYGFNYGNQPVPYAGGIAIVDVDRMADLQTVVLYQQNGSTMIRDIQASVLAHDGIQVALIDIQGFHGSGGLYSGYYGPGQAGFDITEDDIWWTCCDEEGLPRQIAATGDTFIDFDTQATRGVNTVNLLANEVVMGNLWFTQGADNRDGELAEIEQLNLFIPNEVTLPGSEFEGIGGEPVLINRIFASSTLATVTVQGDDVTELVGGEPDSEFDLMLGIPWVASEDGPGGAFTGDPWGIDQGMPGLTTFDASLFEGDLFVAFQYAVGMTITGGSGDDDFYINVGEYGSFYDVSGGSSSAGWESASGVGYLSGTTLDGGPGEDVLWIPMYQFEAIGSDNVITNVEEICFYGWIGEPEDDFRAKYDYSDTLSEQVYNLSGTTYTDSETGVVSRSYVNYLDVSDLGLTDPEDTLITFDGPISTYYSGSSGSYTASTLVLDNIASVINVAFNNFEDQHGNEGTKPVLVFVPEVDTDDDTVNVAFGDQTAASTYVVITDGDVYDVYNTVTKTYDEQQDGEIDTLNIQLGTDCFEVDCLHVALDDMLSLDTITITDGPDTGMYQIAENESMEHYDYGMRELNGLDQYCESDNYKGEYPVELEDGMPVGEDGEPLMEMPKSFAIGTVEEKNPNADPADADTPQLDFFDASESTANIDMWLGSSEYRNGDGTDLARLEFEANDTTVILTGSGNDRLIDSAGDDVINSDGGCDMIIATTGDDLITSGVDGTEGDMDLVVGGDGDDTINGGAGNDIISGDGYGWILALLNEDCLDIDCATAANLLDFFCCQYNECFKDGWAPEWLILEADGGQGTASVGLDSQYCGLPQDEALSQYIYDQIVIPEGNGDMPNNDVIFDLCDIADALRAGEFDLHPYSGSQMVDFDCCDTPVWDFVIRVLDDAMTDIGLIPGLCDLLPKNTAELDTNALSYILANLPQFLDIDGTVAGDDIIMAGEGDDTVHGGGGTDSLYGEDGNDFLVGGDNPGDFRDGDAVELIDGGAGADMMQGGGIHAPGEPQISSFEIVGVIGYSQDDITDGLPDTVLDGDTYTITINGVDYTVMATSSTDTKDSLSQALVDQINGSPTDGVTAEYDGDHIILTGQNGVPFTATATATNGPAPESYNPMSWTVTVADNAPVYDIGDEISVTIQDTNSTFTVSFTVTSTATTEQDIATALKALIDDADDTNSGDGVDDFTVTVSGANVVITSNVATAAFTVTTAIDNVGTGMIYTLNQTGLDMAGESLVIHIDTDGPGGPNLDYAFSTAFNGSTATTLQDFITQHSADILDLMDDGLDNGTDGDDGDMLYIGSDGLLHAYEENGVPGDPLVITAEINGTGVAFITETYVSSVSENVAPSATVTAQITSNQDSSEDIVPVTGEGLSQPAGANGTDGSDLFVIQTGTSEEIGLTPYGPDGVQADTEAFGLPNMLDHVCDFWSLLSPAVTGNTGPVIDNPLYGSDHAEQWYVDNGGQTPDQIAFKTFDGTPLDFGGTVLNYAEYHDVANTYEDALSVANTAMANGRTKYVAVSYNQGVAEDSKECGIDDVFDVNENFLVVFADTNDDNIADTAVRLSGRDNVLFDFHYQDIVALG